MLWTAVVGPGPQRPDMFLCSSSTDRKKRRRSGSEEPPAEPEAEADAGHQGSFGNVGGGGPSVGLNQHLSWDQYKPDRWCSGFSSSFQTL